MFYGVLRNIPTSTFIVIINIPSAWCKMVEIVPIGKGFGAKVDNCGDFELNLVVSGHFRRDCFENN